MLFSAKSRFKYAAFVSYRHKPEDRRWAEWAIEALQRFHTPQALVRKGVRPAIGDLFRDDKEMSTKADLSGYLKEALWASEHLIVICSADTPSSDWVRAEIALFQYWGREDKIHALLIDPDPSRAFPAELRRWKIAGKGRGAVMEMAEPAAASVVSIVGKSEQEIKTLARNKLAAALLNCELGRLREALAKDEAAATTYRYFEQMVSRRGVPEGVGEVPEAHVQHRAATMRFESRGGRVERITRLNGSGYPVENENREARWDITYRADGTVETIEVFTKTGRLKQRQNFNRDATIIDFTAEGDAAAAQGFGGQALGFAPAAAGAVQARSEIVRHLVVYDDHGFIRELRFARDAFNTPAPDPQGNYGEAYERDRRGLPVRRWFLGQDGVRHALKNGVAELSIEYDTKARGVRHAYCDGSGAPVPHQDGYASYSTAYDHFGNIVEQCCFGGDGAATLHKDGFAGITLAYDDRGNQIEGAYFGVDGAPALHKDGYARFTGAYDARGNMVEQAYFGVDGSPTRHKDGYARLTESYDSKGHWIAQTYFGVDGAPTLHKDGFAGITLAYDEGGNQIEWAYFGVDGAPTLHKDGYARATGAYDARGNQIEWAYFGVDGAPTLHKDGYARATGAYDARGNQIESACFGVDGAPTLHKDGYARFTCAYDARGNQIEWAYFGVDGAPSLHRDGYARFTSVYDARGNLIEGSFFDVDGVPTPHKDGFARITNSCDARGNVIKRAFFSVDGAPVLHHEGNAGFSATYDARGNVVEQAYFGVDGAPTLHKDGFAGITLAYDDRGNQIEWAYFGLDGAPTLHKDGFARITGAYDARGRVTETRMFGVNREAVSDVRRYHRRKQDVDALGRPQARRYFGAADEAVARSNTLVDNDHIEDLFKLWRDAVLSGLLTPAELEGIGVGGFHEVQYRYDPRGHIAERRFLGVDGHETIGPNGFSVEIIDHDPMGRPIRFRPRRPDDGAETPIVHLTYDAYGNAIALEYRTPDGALVDAQNGFASITLAYDRFQELREVRYFTAAGDEVSKEQPSSELMEAAS